MADKDKKAMEVPIHEREILSSADLENSSSLGIIFRVGLANQHSRCHFEVVKVWATDKYIDRFQFRIAYVTPAL